MLTEIIIKKKRLEDDLSYEGQRWRIRTTIGISTPVGRMYRYHRHNEGNHDRVCQTLKVQSSQKSIRIPHVHP